MPSVKELIEKISYNDGHFPKNELLEIVNREEEAIPVLLDLVVDVRDNYEKYSEDPNYLAHLYAFFLLAQFRVKEFFPVFIDILRLPSEELDKLMDDFLTEDAGRVLASTFNGDLEALKSLAEDENVFSYARGQAIVALKDLVINGQISEQEVIEYFRKILRESEDMELVTDVVVASDSFNPRELYEDIKYAFDQGKVEDWMINLADIDKTLMMSEDKIHERGLREAKPINNIIEEMHWWACFYNDEEKVWEQSEQERKQPVIKEQKVGRNEPCPCGSGKKYKKCCLD